MKRSTLLAAVALSALTCALPLSGAAQENIGVASVSRNKVTGAFDTKVRDIILGSQVRRNELITTGPDAGTQILFLDETILTLGPNSTMQLDSLVYDPNREGQVQEMVVGALAGTFRFISGNSKSEVYKINTPTATIGMRGSAGDVDVNPNTGETTVVLQSGIFTVTALSGGPTVELTDVGSSTVVNTVDTPPSEPAPPPPDVTDRTAKMDAVITGRGTADATTITTTTEPTTTTTTVNQTIELINNPPTVSAPVDNVTATETVTNPTTTPTIQVDQPPS